MWLASCCVVRLSMRVVRGDFEMTWLYWLKVFGVVVISVLAICIPIIESRFFFGKRKTDARV